MMSLNPQDGQILDALLEVRSGDESSAVHMPADQAGRVEQVSRLLSTLDHYPPEEPPADLVDQTLTRVRESRQGHRFAEQIAVLSTPTSNFGWYEMGAVAAALLIMAALGFPMLSRNKDQAQRYLCAQNLAHASSAMGAYAADHDGFLPRRPVREGQTWFNVGSKPLPDGSATSNSQHSYLLIILRYINPNVLSCPDNADAQKYFAPNATDWESHPGVSYSAPLTPGVVRMDRSPQTVLLVDKNPRFEIRAGKLKVVLAEVDQNSPSRFHRRGEGGQNILMATGEVRWNPHPVTPDGDNLWTIQDKPIQNGDEMPTQPNDIFTP